MKRKFKIWAVSEGPISVVDLISDEIKCRASIPVQANWFGARIRLGNKNELIKYYTKKKPPPIWERLFLI